MRLRELMLATAFFLLLGAVSQGTFAQQQWPIQNPAAAWRAVPALSPSAQTQIMARAALVNGGVPRNGLSA